MPADIACQISHCGGQSWGKLTAGPAAARERSPVNGNRGKRLVVKFASVQMAAAAVVAVVCMFVSGANAARSALIGGLIVALGTLVFGWQLFAKGWPAAEVARGFFLGELLKWIWIAAALWAAFTHGGFEPLPLLLGLIAAHSGFWVAMGVFK
jgi:F0F1-type ATP synthase assembly protein I